MRDWGIRTMLAIASGVILGSFAAGAQTVTPMPGSQPSRTTNEAKIGYTINRGMPYSGIWVTKHVFTFPDGQVQKDQNTRKVWRDSDGRTREEDTWTRRIGGDVATVYRIEDPVAQVRYIWRIQQDRQTIVTETHFNLEKYAVAEIWPNPPTHQNENPTGKTAVILGATRLADPNSHEEKLGPMYMNGVYAEGVRSVYPVQSDPDHRRVEETWEAPDLNLFIKSYLDTGTGTIEDSELKNIDRSEPDRSMFVPPSDLPRRRVPESDPVWSEGWGDD